MPGPGVKLHLCMVRRQEDMPTFLRLSQGHGADVGSQKYGETPLHGASMMADEIREELRKPDFSSRTIEWGDSSEAQEKKEHRLLSRELAEEGGDIRSVEREGDTIKDTIRSTPWLSLTMFSVNGSLR